MDWESTEFIALGVFLITAIGLAALGLTLKSDPLEEAVIA
jgi:hypothetical protein